MRVPYLDLTRETAALRDELDAAIARVLDSGHYILSEEVERFESAFAAACTASYAVGVASGTDAITIALLAAGVGAGDEVITAPNTCIPTIVGIERAGATPVLADVDRVTYTLDPTEVERRLTPRTKAILPVHLYGQPADLDSLLALGAAHGVAVVEDCAQAHGATVGGKPVGSFGAASAFSFYPTKNLGAIGDAGAVVTQSAEIAGRARLLRNYGEQDRFEHVLRGLNSRLDPIQAAVLSAKLGGLSASVERRRRLAAVYHEALVGSSLTTPAEAPAASTRITSTSCRHPTATGSGPPSPKRVLAPRCTTRPQCTASRPIANSTSPAAFPSPNHSASTSSACRSRIPTPTRRSAPRQRRPLSCQLRDPRARRPMAQARADAPPVVRRRRRDRAEPGRASAPAHPSRLRRRALPRPQRGFPPS